MQDVRLIKPSIHVQYVFEMLEGARSKGLDLDAVLIDAGVNPTVLNNPQTKISIQIYYRIIRIVRDMLQDDFYGFFTKKTPPKTFGVFCQGVTGFPDAYHVVEYAKQFYRLFIDEFYWSLVTDKRKKITQFNLHLKIDAEINPKFIIEALLLNPYKLCSWLVGELLPIKAAYFTFPKPQFHLQHQYLFGRNIIYNADRNGLDFDTPNMNHPVVRTHGDLALFLKNWSSILFLNPYAYPYTRMVRQKLLALKVEHGFPSFQQIAHSLNISHQNLWRKLNKEEISYQKIKDQLRQDIAMHMLSRADSNIADVAARVGYADERHFYRMFKAWTGMSPGAYRKLLQL